MFSSNLLSQFPAILQGGSVLAAQQWLIERLGAGVTQADVEDMGSLVASRNLARDPQTRDILDSLIAEKAGVDLAKITAPATASRMPQTIPAFLLFQKEAPREMRAGAFLAASSFETPRMQAAAEETPATPAAASETPKALPTPEEIIPMLSSSDIFQRRDAAIRGTLILEDLEMGAHRTIASILGDALVREAGRNGLLEAAKRFVSNEELNTLMESIFGSGEAGVQSESLIEELLEYLLQRSQGGDQTTLMQILIGKLPTAHHSLKPLLIRVLAPRVDDVVSSFRAYLAEKYPGTVRRVAAVYVSRALPRLEKIPFDLVLEIFGTLCFNFFNEESGQILSSLEVIIPKLGEDEKMELARKAVEHCQSDFISSIGPHVYRSHLPEIIELALAAIFNRRHQHWHPRQAGIPEVVAPLDAKERLKLARKLKKQYLREEVNPEKIIFFLGVMEELLKKFDEEALASFAATSGEKALAPFAESAGGLLKHADPEVRKGTVHFLNEIFSRLEAEAKIRTVEALEQIPANDLPVPVCTALANGLPHLEESLFKERALSLGKRILDAEAADFRWEEDSLFALIHQIADAHLEKFKDPESLRALYQLFQGRLFNDSGELNTTAAAASIVLSTYFGPEERMAQMFFFGGLLSLRGGSGLARGSIFRTFETERERFSPAERRLMALLTLPHAPHLVTNFLAEEGKPHFAYLLAARVGQGKIERGPMLDQVSILRGLIKKAPFKDSQEILRIALELLPALGYEDEVVREWARECLQTAADRLEKPALETLGLKVAEGLGKLPTELRKESREFLFEVHSSLEEVQRYRLLLSLEGMLWEEEEAKQAYGEELFRDLLVRSELSPEKLWEVAWNFKPRLEDPQPRHRRVAVEVLGKVGELSGSTEILWLMIAALLDDKEKIVRDEAKKSICKIFGSTPAGDQPAVAQGILKRIHRFRGSEEEKILDAVEALKDLAMMSGGEARFVFLDYLIGLMSNVMQKKDPFIRKAVVAALSSREFQVVLKGTEYGEDEAAVRKFLHQLEWQLAHNDAGVRLALAKVMVATVQSFSSSYNFVFCEPHLRTLAGMLLGDDSEEVRTTLIGFFEKMKAARGEEIRQFAERVLATFSPPPPKSES